MGTWNPIKYVQTAPWERVNTYVYGPQADSLYKNSLKKNSRNFESKLKGLLRSELADDIYRGKIIGGIDL